MHKDWNLNGLVKNAVQRFWATKHKQHKYSSDTSNRGSVTGGKQLDGFLSLIRAACMNAGVPSSCIYIKNNYIPGFFRSSKDWDLIVISPSGKLLVLVELKSQIGSYGNNFNNRAEEALGNAADLWTAYREKQFPTCGIPWVGYLMLIGKDDKSTVPVKNQEPYYSVLPDFHNASYIDRYRVLCEKLISERMYTCTCLLWTDDSTNFGNVSEDISIERFINSLQGYLSGVKDEFNT